MRKALGGMFIVALAIIASALSAHADGFPDCGWQNVPEPGTLALLASGIGALALCRPRRQN